MSALFDPGTGTLTSSLTIIPSLELRQVPLTQITNISMSEDYWIHGLPSFFSDDDQRSLLTGDFYDMRADWMYTAIIQTALNGPAPPWTKDDWSFVPTFLTPENLLDAKDLVRRSQNVTTHASLRFQTPAIRARLDCSTIDMAKNTSTWIGIINATTDTGRLESFYRLGASMFGDPRYNLTTSVTAQGISPQCCDNATEVTFGEHVYNPAVIAYWTENRFLDNILGNNFTIKWIRGPSRFVYYGVYNLVFTEAPVMQALNCMPTLEASEADVLVDLTSGTVQEYRILRTPVSDDVAWSDSWVLRNFTEKPAIKNVTAWDTGAWNSENTFPTNITTRYVCVCAGHSNSNRVSAMEFTS
jgi:hypothetical protein